MTDDDVGRRVGSHVRHELRLTRNVRVVEFLQLSLDREANVKEGGIRQESK